MGPLNPAAMMVWRRTGKPRAGRVSFEPLLPGVEVPSGFDQSLILSVFPPVQYGTQIFLTWTSNAPPGTWFQVLCCGSLQWYGRIKTATIQAGPAPMRSDIGRVQPGQQQIDYSGGFPSPPQRFAVLNWLGGTYQAADISGFNVYGAVGPGAAIDFTTPVARIPAYTGGVSTDGFGSGQFGYGGFGQSSASYTWRSGPLRSGIWPWAITPYDRLGNLGTTTTTSVTIQVPPLEVPEFTDGAHLHYSYAKTPSQCVTLSWLPSNG
jgi:hypothetical protein